MLLSLPGIVVGLAIFASSGPTSKVVASPGTTPVTLRGRVLMLPAALKSRGLDVKVDLEPIARQAVLLGEDGVITPLLSDDASRALFLDDTLRNRRAEVKCLRFQGVPYVQVLTFKVEYEGRLETPEYFCEICAISVRFPQICPCCQGPMVLRMKSEGR